MVLISLMPDSGTGTSGQMVTPGPVRLMRRLQHLTKSSTYAESPRSDKWLKDPTRITLPCGSAPYGLIWSLNTSLKMPSMSPNILSSALITNMQVSPLPAGTKGQKLWSASTTQTGFHPSFRTACFSGQVTHTIALGSKDIEMISLSFRLW